MSLNSRRSFLSVVASFAGLAAVPWSSVDIAAQPAVSPDPLRLVRNFIETFREVHGLEPSQLSTAVGIAAWAFPMNASDRLWAKYRLGERSKIIDPTTKKPAVRNIFLEGSGNTVKAMQAMGTVFWQCHRALGGEARDLAEENSLPVAEVRADLVAGLNPGVRLVPSHVMLLGLAQERGFTYVKS